MCKFLKNSIMFDDLLQNLFLNAKNQIDEQKKQLGDKVIDFISSDEKISVKINGNYEILDIKIDKELLSEPVELIEDLLVVNLNKAIKKVDEVRKEILDNTMNNAMPDLGAMFDALDDDEEE